MSGSGEELRLPEDPYLWLEEVDGEDALAWVRARSAETLGRAEADPAWQALRAEILEVLDSDARIPLVTEHDGLLYNLWRDAAHPRGLWRRTTLAEYRTDAPAWETLLDVDALGAAEGEPWVWAGAVGLPPTYERWLIQLSRGGADAVVVRELDLPSRRWVEDGFRLPEAKQDVAWIDEDTLYVATDTGPGSLTTSGYPRTVRRWRRGTPLAAAELVHEGEPDDVAVAAEQDHTPGFPRGLVVRAIDFYRAERFLIRDGALVRIPIPESAELQLARETALIELRDPWEVDGRTWPEGALLATDLDALLAGRPVIEPLFLPDDRSALRAVVRTRSHLVLVLLDDVRNRVEILTRGPAGWDRSPLPDLPELATVSVEAVDADRSDALWITIADPLTPATLHRQEIGGAREALKGSPAFFDATGLTLTRHVATSADGTPIPYVVTGPRDLAADGSHPVLLYGYGGFEVSLLPAYSGTIGRAWLAHGGVHVVANIRGGGEYGPRWHRAALREERPRAFEDFAAVARDLVARGITTPSRLGIQGGSNGGLLVGSVLTRDPELLGAVVCQVPLLDMLRYHRLLAGASWMAEYGDPDDPADRAYLESWSPYANVSPERRYPPLLLLTSTRDDRVHPGHARKMAARMLALGHDVTYWENMEGGHGGAAENRQLATMQALAWGFLRERLARGG